MQSGMVRVTFAKARRDLCGTVATFCICARIRHALADVTISAIAQNKFIKNLQRQRGERLFEVENAAMPISDYVSAVFFARSDRVAREALASGVGRGLVPLTAMLALGRQSGCLPPARKNA
jgi:hypothetical protein